jgi:PAS domain S-box-containing protein
MLLDQQFNLMYINHTSPGFDKKSILGKPVYNLAPEEQREAIKQCYQRVLDSGVAERFESDYYRDGKCINYESSVAPLYQNDQIYALAINSRDITEYKRLNKHIRLLLESTGDGIFGVDRNMRCTFINQAAMEMLNCTNGELIGQDMYLLLNCMREDGTSISREECPISLTLTTNNSHWSENEILWRSGENYIPVEYSSDPITENGIVTGAVVVFRNVSEARAIAKKMDYLATHDA